MATHKLVKFKQEFPRFPEYSDAIAKLRPGAPFGIIMNDYTSIDWQDESSAPPTETEIKAKLEELIAEWEVADFRRHRYLAYPEIEVQLAMIYDDMAAGRLPGAETSEWFALIKGIKEQYPPGTFNPDVDPLGEDA